MFQSQTKSGCGLVVRKSSLYHVETENPLNPREIMLFELHPFESWIIHKTIYESISWLVHIYISNNENSLIGNVHLKVT